MAFAKIPVFSQPLYYPSDVIVRRLSCVSVRCNQYCDYRLLLVCKNKAPMHAFVGRG